jgi:hypothetical protein
MDMKFKFMTRRGVMKKVIVLCTFVCAFVAASAFAQQNRVVVVPLGSSAKLGSAIMSATVNPDGTILRGSSGITAIFVSTGNYRVTFPTNVDQCQWLGTVGGDPSGTVNNRSMGITQCISTTDCLWVTITDTFNDTGIDDRFGVMVHCP